jgi:hypothetical protein
MVNVNCVCDGFPVCHNSSIHVFICIVRIHCCKRYSDVYCISVWNICVSFYLILFFSRLLARSLCCVMFLNPASLCVCSGSLPGGV